MTTLPPLMAEIEAILLANVGRTRFSLVLEGMRRGLSNEEMSAEADRDGIPCSAESIGMVRRTLTLTLADQLHPAPSDAENQSYLYREVLNYDHSPELHQLVMTRLHELQAIDPNVKLTPLGNVHLGAGNCRSAGKLPELCTKCWTHHAGECL
ncbi:hypothetical protein [Mycobacterium sp. pW045]|uniref:hypothetical protein n=1 Tax=Mycobacterium sp. pW045 TaxID=3238984 RepID=UPI00351AC5D0